MSVFIKLLLFEFQFLVVFQSLSKFSQIFTHRLVLKLKLVDLTSVLINLVNNCFVTGKKVKLGLDSVVFFI